MAWSPSLRDRRRGSDELASQALRLSYRSRPCLIDLSICGCARTSREPHFEHFRNRQTSSTNVSPGRFKSSPRRLLRFGHLLQLTTIKRPRSLAIVSGPSSPWLTWPVSRLAVPSNEVRPKRGKQSRCVANAGTVAGRHHKAVCRRTMTPLST